MKRKVGSGRIRGQGESPVRALIARGAAAYVRRRILPRLLPLASLDLDATDPEAIERIITALSRAARAERTRGRAGHWSYDLNRHIGLVQAIRAETALLRDARRSGPAGGIRKTKSGPDQ